MEKESETVSLSCRVDKKEKMVLLRALSGRFWVALSLCSRSCEGEIESFSLYLRRGEKERGVVGSVRETRVEMEREEKE
jgi:hypothetical protein